MNVHGQKSDAMETNLVKAEDQIKDIRAGFVALIYEQFNPCTYSGICFHPIRVLEIVTNQKAENYLKFFFSRIGKTIVTKCSYPN